MKKLFILICLSASACSPTDLPKYSALQSLRVLTLNLDNPEINYNGAVFTPSTVNLTPWVSDLYGAGRGLSYNLEWCLDPGIAFGATPRCAENPTRTIVAQAQAVATTATFLAPNYTGTLDSIAVDLTAASAPTLALVSQRFLASSSIQQFNGLALILVYEIYPTNNSALKVTSFKRIIISSSAKTTKNTNPGSLEIRTGGTEITTLPASDTSMLAYYPAGQAESYLALDSLGNVGSKVESLVTTWFFTAPEDVVCANDDACTPDGSFKLTRTSLAESNFFYAPKVSTPTSRGRVLIAVGRDNRGGNTAKRYCFGTCP